MFVGFLLKVDVCADLEGSIRGSGKSQSYQASIQCQAIIGPPAKRHFISMYLDPLSPHQLNKYKNKTSYLDRTTWQNFLDPRIRWLYYCRSFASDSTFGQNGSGYLLILGFII